MENYKSKVFCGDGYCSLELASKLCDAAFIADCPFLWAFNDDESYIVSSMSAIDVPFVNNSLLNDSPDDVFYVAAPTLSVANEWIRETYNMHVSTEPYVTNEGIKYLFKLWAVDKENLSFQKIKESTGYESPYDAIENGLMFVFNKILKM